MQMRDDSYGKIISIENMCPVGITVIKLKSGKEVVGDGTLETEPFRILGR